MLSRRELVALTLLFLASLPAVTTRLYSSDEVEYFSYLRSLWFDRDVSFENEYQYFYEHRIAQSEDFHHTFLELETATGRRINYGTIGCAILWAPFYGAADAVTRLMRAAGRDVAADGYSRPYVAGVAYGSAFYGFVAIVLSILAARRVVGPFALGSGIAVWLGTPLLFYMYVAPPFSHACSAFAVALFVTIWLHVRERWSVGGAIALGLAGALMAMVREQDLLFAFGPVFDVGLALGDKVKGRREKVKTSLAVLTGCAAFTLGYLPQLLAYKALNGKFGPSPLVTRKMYWSAPHALQVLADPEHGFFFWTPLAVLAVIGLVVLMTAGLKASTTGATPTGPTPTVVPPFRAAGSATVGGCMLLMLALQVYVSGAVESWTVAGAFGQRRFVSVTILLVVGLTALRAAVHARPSRLALNAVIIVCVWWNVGLMAAFGTSMMDRQRLELRRNAYDAFITLPRTAPDLAYRYFTKRSSFYKPPAQEPR
jgi:hypothetical protein